MIITIIFLGEIQFFLNPKIWSSLRVVVHFNKIFDIVVAGIVASAPRFWDFLKSHYIRGILVSINMSNVSI